MKKKDEKVTQALVMYFLDEIVRVIWEGNEMRFFRRY